jgi:hypothetical protein
LSRMDRGVSVDASHDEGAVTWSDSFDTETVAAAYEDARSVLPLCASWADSIDAKTIAVFGIASSILTIVPALRPLSKATLPLVLWCLALSCWIISMGFCLAAYKPTQYRIDPNPQTTSRAAWLTLTPTLFRYYRLEDMATTYVHNRNQIDRKGWRLRAALIVTAAEVICVSLAQIVS